MINFVIASLGFIVGFSLCFFLFTWQFKRERIFREKNDHFIPVAGYNPVITNRYGGLYQAISPAPGKPMNINHPPKSGSGVPEK